MDPMASALTGPDLAHLSSQWGPAMGGVVGELEGGVVDAWVGMGD